MDPIFVNEAPDHTVDGKRRRCQVIVPATHLTDPGSTPHPIVVGEIDRTFAAMTPPARRVGEPVRKTPAQMAAETGSKVENWDQWAEWWIAQGEEIS